MKLNKRFLLFLLLVVAIPLIYYFYCQVFWNIFYTNYRENYVFTIDSNLDSDSSVTLYNYKDCIWEGICIEPIHGLWLNKTQIYFVEDTLMFVSIAPSYIEGNEWTFPVLFPFGLEKEERTYNFFYDLHSNRFITKIKISNQKLVIEKAFL